MHCFTHFIYLPNLFISYIVKQIYILKKMFKYLPVWRWVPRKFYKENEARDDTPFSLTRSYNRRCGKYRYFLMTREHKAENSLMNVRLLALFVVQFQVDSYLNLPPVVLRLIIVIRDHSTED